MENTLLGLLIKDEEGCIWRIIQTNGIITKGCLVEAGGTACTKLKFCEWETIRLYDDMLSGKMTKIEEPEGFILDEDDLKEEALQAYRNRKAFVLEAVSSVASNYDMIFSKENRKHIETLCKTYGYCSASGWKFIRKYLQGGMKLSSLLDGRLTRTDERRFVGKLSVNPGKKNGEDYNAGKVLTPEDLKNIEWGIELFLNSSSASIKYCYLKVLIHFYLDENGDLRKEHPSERQFYYQLMLHTTAEERSRAKRMKSDFENNSRLLYGTPRSDALRPGQILEADECELDVMVVSSVNNRKILGRPIVYFLCDLYSHTIVGLSVHLHNNSIVGITSAMLNLFESKTDYCSRYDIDFSDTSLWPSCFIPEEIRSDQGSEYGSDQFASICQLLNIRCSFAPPGMGSYKGTVERSFGSLMSLLRPELENYGLISKRADSNHYKTATYTMKDITRLCINFAIFHNNMVIDKMKISREMAMNGVRKSPVDIWKWGVEHRGQPTRMITSANLAETIFKILTPMNARLSRDGVSVNGLRYLPADDDELIARLMKTVIKGKSETMDVRIDPRSTNNIFYLKNGHIAQMNLVKDDIGNDWQDMVWDEVDAEKEIIRTQDRRDKNEKLRLKCKELSNIENILDNANKPEFKPEKKNIRENRMDERKLIDEKESAASKMNAVKAPSLQDPTETQQAKETDEADVAGEIKKTKKKGKTTKESTWGSLSNKDAFIEAMEETGRFEF